MTEREEEKEGDDFPEISSFHHTAATKMRKEMKEREGFLAKK